MSVKVRTIFQGPGAGECCSDPDITLENRQLLQTPIEYISYPYARVLWSPSRVLRSLLYYDPARGALWPAGVLGIIYVLVKALVANKFISLFPEIMLACIAGYIGGLCNLFLIAFGMSIVSNWFKGYGLFDPIKQVVSWSCFPFLFGLPIFLAGAISLQIIWPESNPLIGIILGAAYLLIAGAWGMYIQWSGIRILFKGNKIIPIGIIVLPYVLMASFVFMTQQLYGLFH